MAALRVKRRRAQLVEVDRRLDRLERRDGIGVAERKPEAEAAHLVRLGEREELDGPAEGARARQGRCGEAVVVGVGVDLRDIGVVVDEAAVVRSSVWFVVVRRRCVEVCVGVCQCVYVMV